MNGIIRAFFWVLFYNTKNKRPNNKTYPLGFPYELMLLSYTIWIMSFIGHDLSRGGRTWSDYWNQVLIKIIYSQILAKYPPFTIIYNTTKAISRKKLFLLGLMAASNKYDGVPNT